MKKLIAILALTLATNALAQKEIRLYDGVAPGSEGVNDNERVTRGPDGNIQSISGVVTPSITVYLPDADKATGTADRNQWLAENRAKNVYDMLVNEYGVPASSLVLDSKGGVDNLYFNDPQMSRSVIIQEVK